MLGAPGLWVPWAVPWGFHPPEQAWVPRLVLHRGPVRVLSSSLPNVQGCLVRGVILPRPQQAAALGAGALGGCRGRVGHTPLQHRLELQGLDDILLIVLVAGLDDGATPLRVLNQVVPVLIVLGTKRRENSQTQRARTHWASMQAQLRL